MHNKPIFILLVFFYTFCISAMEETEKPLAYLIDSSKKNSSFSCVSLRPLNLYNKADFTCFFNLRESHQETFDADADETRREYDEELATSERAYQEKKQRKLKQKRLERKRQKEKNIREQGRELTIKIQKRLRAKTKRRYIRRKKINTLVQYKMRSNTKKTTKRGNKVNKYQGNRSS